ncbi:MAG: ATPase [Anaerolineae bacterium]|nr:ATPase [Anaerolineae bacterium]
MNQRVNTGVPGLDKMLNGGLLPQTSNLVEGAPGCGKSTLGMQFIYEGTQKGEPGIILTFEEFPQQYYRDAATYGWDFKKLEREGLLRVIMSSPEVSKADLERVNGTIEKMIDAIHAKRILVDSISQFERMSEDPVVLRNLIYSFLNSLKRKGLTTMLTRESSYLWGESDTEEELDSGLSFVVDSYITLRYVEIDSTVNRAIIVMKIRGSAHDTRIFQFDIGAQGMEVGKPFEGQEGILSGAPTRMAESFIKAFVKR